MLCHRVGEHLHAVRKVASVDGQQLRVELLSLESDCPLEHIILEVTEGSGILSALKYADLRRPNHAQNLVKVAFWVDKPLQNAIKGLLTRVQKLVKLLFVQIFKYCFIVFLKTLGCQ